MRALQLDHLVIGASSLDAASRWCEQQLGVSPQPGGRHALMGTHNRLLQLSSRDHPRCYLEFIAIDPEAPAPAAHRRWFGLDEAATQARLAQGPALLHWVARATHLATMRSALQALGLDPGEPLAASRGDLHWQISVRRDGLPQCGGALPTLIDWGDSRHPSDSLPASGWQLKRLQLQFPAGLAAQLQGPGGRLLELSTA